MAILYPPMNPACSIPRPASGFSLTTSGASDASDKNAENSLDALFFTHTHEDRNMIRQ